jgi:hypothetical protein
MDLVRTVGVTRGLVDRQTLVKRCPRCQAEKPLTAFGLRKHSPTGRKSWCRACESAGQQQRFERRSAAGLCRTCGKAPRLERRLFCAACLDGQAKRREAWRRAGRCAACGGAAAGRAKCQACLIRTKATHLAARTGIAATQCAQVLLHQGACCAICRAPGGPGRPLAVDCCGATGRVRGLLCPRCRSSVARYEQYAERFAGYLTDPPAAGRPGSKAGRPGCGGPAAEGHP